MASEPSVRLGFAGAGWMAAVHGYAVDQIPGLSITKVASRDPEKAAQAAARVGADAVSYDDVTEGVDGVVVCTPPALHASQALAATKAGAAVLVEKPLCTTLADADALVEAEASGASIAYAENLVHAPAVRLALAHASQLHGIDLLEVRALQQRPTWGDFLDPAWGGGVLFDLGVHPLAIALLASAPARPVELRCVLEGADDHDVDEHADVTIRFEGDVAARVVASWREPDPTWDAQISSPDGVVRLELLPEVRLERNGAEVRLPPSPEGVPAQLEEMGYLPQMEAFARDVAAGTQPALGAAFGRSVLDVVCAAYASAGAGGAWIELPWSGRRDRTPIGLWRDPAR